MHDYVRISPMVNGEQEIEKFDTYEEATANATPGDGIYKLMEVTQ